MVRRFRFLTGGLLFPLPGASTNLLATMRFDVLTIFPDFFTSPLATSILKRALEAGCIDVAVHNIRDWTTDKHHCTDDAPYGGGGGMVMLADPLLRAIRDVRKQSAQATGPERRAPLVYLSPQGEPLCRRIVQELAQEPGLILLCGTYEGIDERVAEMEVDREISIGDYVLTSGEPAALVLLNAVARRLEGVLGNPDSAANDSFEAGLLDYPHYTRPETVEGRPVPEVLMSGHHAKIVQWRREQQLQRTARRRPELLLKAQLTAKEIRWLKDQGLWPAQSAKDAS